MAQQRGFLRDIYLEDGGGKVPRMVELRILPIEKKKRIVDGTAIVRYNLICFFFFCEVLPANLRNIRFFVPFLLPDTHKTDWMEN